MFKKGLTRGWSLRERLRFYSARHPSGCLIWTGAVNPDGYGKICIGHSKVFRAHRVAWELKNGPIPPGAHILHKCDVPSCIEPSHLFLGDHKENMSDRAKKLRAAKKLTPSLIRKIRKETNLSQAKIAKKYRISQGTVWDIKSRKTWKHIS